MNFKDCVKIVVADINVQTCDKEQRIHFLSCISIRVKLTAHCCVIYGKLSSYLI